MKSTARFSSILALSLILISHQSIAWKKNDHERMGSSVKDIMSCLKNSSYSASDSSWADTQAARDGKGTLYISEEKTTWTAGIGDLGHARFNDWPRGHAHQNAQGFFNKATSQDRGYILARGSHFIQDVGQPFHTYGQLFCQAYHLTYEQWVYDNWTSKGFRDAYMRGLNSQLSNNSPSKGLSKDQLTDELAKLSRGYMSKLCSNGPKWKDNPEATRTLLYHVGRYTAAYVRGGDVCN